MATITVQPSDQIWLKNGKSAAGEAWSFSVSGLPSGAIINSVTLTYAAGCTGNTPGRTSIYWGSSTSGTRIWTVSGSGSGLDYTVDLKSYIKGNGSYSLYFYKTASTVGTQTYSYVYFSGVKIVIDYTVPKSTFTLSDTSVEAGGTVTVSISRLSSVYTHTVTFTFGSRSHVMGNVGTSASYTIPMEWLDQIPASASGSGTVTVETLNGSTSLGANAKALTITCPASVVPTAGVLTVSPVEALNGNYIQNHSKAQVTLTGYSAGTGATVTSVVIKGGGYSAIADTLSTGYLGSSGSLTFSAVVTDSRNRTASVSTKINIVPYVPVQITGVACARCDATGALQPVTGTCAKLGCSYSITTLDGDNAADVRIMWRKPGEDWLEILDWDDTSGYTAVTLVDMIDVTTRYEIRFLVEDLYSSAEQIYPIASGKVFMRWEKTNEAIGFGCFPQGTKRVEIAEDWDFYFKNQSLDQRLTNIENNAGLDDNPTFNIVTANKVIGAVYA